MNADLITNEIENINLITDVIENNISLITDVIVNVNLITVITVM